MIIININAARYRGLITRILWFVQALLIYFIQNWSLVIVCSLNLTVRSIVCIYVTIISILKTRSVICIAFPDTACTTGCFAGRFEQSLRHQGVLSSTYVISL